MGVISKRSRRPAERAAGPLRRRRTPLLALCLIGMAAAPAARPESRPIADPPGAAANIILDTDMWSDIDDAMALCMLHALADRGEARILAVTVSSDDPWPVSFAGIVNRFYGRPAIPVARVRRGIDAGAYFRANPELADTPELKVSYTEFVSRMKDGEGRAIHPRRPPRDTIDAVTLLRRTLARQADGSVTIVQLGYSTNLSRLLQSGPDRFSPLDGRALVKRKVRLLTMMAGNFEDVVIAGRTIKGGQPEFNVRMDIDAARSLVGTWPTPIVAAGSELGMAVRYSGQRIETDFRYARHHPFVDAYRYASPFWLRLSHSARRFHDHHTADLPALLHAVRPQREDFDLSGPGRLSIAPGEAVMRFTPDPQGTHRYLRLAEDRRDELTTLYELLVSQPPRRPRF